MQYTSLLPCGNRHGTGFDVSRLDQEGFLCEGTREFSHGINCPHPPVKEHGEKPGCLADPRKLSRDLHTMTSYAECAEMPGKHVCAGCE